MYNMTPLNGSNNLTIKMSHMMLRESNGTPILKGVKLHSESNYTPSRII